jgi:hypothetical protein
MEARAFQIERDNTNVLPIGEESKTESLASWFEEIWKKQQKIEAILSLLNSKSEPSAANALQKEEKEKQKPNEMFDEICREHYEVLSMEYKARVSFLEVKRVLQIFIQRMQDRLVIGGEYKVSMKEIIDAVKYGQNGFSGKAELILWLYLAHLKKKGETKIPFLGKVHIQTVPVSKKHNKWFICVDIDQDDFFN